MERLHLTDRPYATALQSPVVATGAEPFGYAAL